MAPSKSQAPAPNLDPSWMVVPLARFSHATSPKGALKHQWIHEPPRDELCLVFRPVRDAVDGSMRSTVRMLVYAGAEVLEDQNVDLLLEHAYHLDQLKQKGLADSRDEAPLRVVVRSPCIAFRFPAPLQSPIRRVQLKFKSDTDYNKAVDICAKLKLPVEFSVKNVSSSSYSAPTMTPVRPVIAISSGTMQQQVLASTELPSNLQTHPNHPLQMPNLISRPMSRPLSAAEFDIMRSQSVRSDTMRPDSVLSMNNINNGRTFDAASSPFIRGFGLPNFSSEEIRALDTPSPLNRSRIGLSNPAFEDMQDLPPISRDISNDRFPFDVSSSRLPLIQQKLSQPMSSSCSMHSALLKDVDDCLVERPFGQTSESLFSVREPADHRALVADETDQQPSILISQALKKVLASRNNGDNQGVDVTLPAPRELSRRDHLLDEHMTKIRSISNELEQAKTPQASSYFGNTSLYDNDHSQLRRSATTSDLLRDHRQALDQLQQGRNRSLPEPIRPISLPNFDWMPPKRELPFPADKPPKSAYIAEPPSTAAMNPVGAGRTSVLTPTPTEVPSVAVPKKATKRVAQRRAPPKKPALRVEDKISISRQQESSPLAAKSVVITRPSTAPGLQSKAVVCRKRQTSSAVESEQPKKVLKQTIDQSTQTQTLSGRDHTVSMETMPRGEMMSRATQVEAFSHTSSRPEPTLTPIISPPMPSSFVDQIQALVVAHSSHPPQQQELWQKPGYMDASPEERQAIINDFICENLEDENFLRLTEDLGEVWRRIGLGV